MKEIYCDGSCFGNPGPGGWGVWVTDKSLTAEIYGHKAQTTNNQMELMAAITAVKFVSIGEQATIYTDSQYVIKGITEWLKGWKKNNWLTAKKEAVKNSDLWKELDAQTQGKKLNWVWVKAHNGNQGNEIVDSLAKMGTQGKSNMHILEEQLAKFVNIKNSTEEIVSNAFPCYSLVSHKNKKYFVLNVDVLIYPQIDAYALVELDSLKNIVIEKSQAHKEFKLIEGNDSYKITLSMLNKVQSTYQENYHKYKQVCKHHITEKSESAICNNCGVDFGWYCEKSPDNI